MSRRSADYSSTRLTRVDPINYTDSHVWIPFVGQIPQAHTTYTTVTTVVSAIPPSPPPSPSPVASPPSDDEPPFVSFLESLGVPAPIVDVLVAIFTLITDLFAGLFD